MKEKALREMLEELCINDHKCNIAGNPVFITRTCSKIIDLIIKKLPQKQNFSGDVVAKALSSGHNSCLTQLKTVLNQMRKE